MGIDKRGLALHLVCYSSCLLPVRGLTYRVYGIFLHLVVILFFDDFGHFNVISYRQSFDLCCFFNFCRFSEVALPTEQHQLLQHLEHNNILNQAINLLYEHYYIAGGLFQHGVN